MLDKIFKYNIYENIDFNKQNKILNIEFNLIIHINYFDKCYEILKSFIKLLGRKRCTIITTINKVSKTIEKHIQNLNYDTIIGCKLNLILKYL